MGIVDIFCRTIADLVIKYLTTDNTKYINVLPDLVHNYSTSYYKGIAGAPAKNNEEHMKQINIQRHYKANHEETIFQIGDNVIYLIEQILLDACFPNGQQQFTK